jgi:hypothetical protein
VSEGATGGGRKLDGPRQEKRHDSHIQRQPTAPSAFTATIAWGDGDSGSVSIVQSNGAFQVHADHTYLVAATYTPRVTITDAAGDVVTESATTAISDAPLSATGATAFAGVNSPATVTVATFTDADPNAGASSYSATIAWGDGTSSAGVVAQSSDVFAVSGNHIYTTTGAFAPTATIQDVSSSATATGSVFVSTMTAAAQPVSLAEATSTTVTLATFSDSQPGPDTAVIDWGDGTDATDSVVSGASGNYTVSGSHAYEEGGAYQATVTITNAASLTSVLSVAATVSDAPLTATGTNVSAAQGADLGAVVVATFSDADLNATADSFSASVDWGDGSYGDSSTTVTQAGSTFTVTDDHTYLTQGTFIVTTTITDATGAATVATSSATVGVGPIIATPTSITATGDVAAHSVAVATFTGTASVSGATIDWGNWPSPLRLGSASSQQATRSSANSPLAISWWPCWAWENTSWTYGAPTRPYGNSSGRCFPDGSKPSRSGFFFDRETAGSLRWVVEVRDPSPAHWVNVAGGGTAHNRHVRS